MSPFGYNRLLDEAAAKFLHQKFPDSPNTPNNFLSPRKLFRSFSQLICIRVLLKLDSFRISDRPNVSNLRLTLFSCCFLSAKIITQPDDLIASIQKLINLES